MSVDHLTDWRQACAAANDRQELEELYHEVNNLEAVHTNCNASKGQKDLFEWWKSALPAPYVDNAEVLKNLQWESSRSLSTGASLALHGARK